MTPAESLPHDRASRTDWVAVAEELAPIFAARAAGHDADDAFVFENYADLRKRRVFSAAVPVELGRGDASPRETCEMLRTLARGCSSTALALAMHTHQVLVPAWRWRHERAPVEPFLRRVAAEELVIASSGGSDWLTGSGRADKVEGGYRVTSRKIFASGSPAADVFSTMAIYDDPADGATVLHFAIPLDTPGLKRHDNWRALGMRGTGSHDVSLDGVFVPDAAISARRPSGRWSHLWHVVAAMALPAIYAVYLGVAEAARDAALREAGRRRDDHGVQEMVGAMDTELIAARVAWRFMVDAANRDGVGADVTNEVMIGRTLVGQAAFRTVEAAMEVANQLKAAGILEKVYAEQPNHPGAAHYIIHSYDYPPLANRALAAARAYAKIAPAVPHALHMPAHIFTRLGLWQESIDSNRASADAGKTYYAQLGKSTVWDQTLHALDYVVYAYLQTGQDREARKVLEELGTMQRAEPASLAAAYAYAAIPARVALERHQWREAAALGPGSTSFPWDRYPWAQAITAFARAIGAARSGDAAGAQAEGRKLVAYHDALVAANQTYWAEQVNVQQQAAAAWAARAEGKSDEGLRLMRAAADLEDSTEKHPVTPGPVVPARELLGEMLLDLKQPAQALVEFDASAKRDPNRFNGLFGAARAAELSGDMARARALYERVVALSAHGEGDRPELRHARAIIAK